MRSESILYLFTREWTRRRRTVAWYSGSSHRSPNSKENSSVRECVPDWQLLARTENNWEGRNGLWMLAGWQDCARRALGGERYRRKWGLGSERSIDSLETVPKFGKRFFEHLLRIIVGHERIACAARSNISGTTNQAHQAYDKLMDVRPERPNESPHHKCSRCGSRALTRLRRQGITDHLLAALFGLRPYECDACSRRYRQRPYAKENKSPSQLW